MEITEMTWSKGNKCPVCGNASEEALPKMGDTTEVICDICGRFRVTGSAEATMRGMTTEDRTALLEKAKRTSEATSEIPTIRGG